MHEPATTASPSTPSIEARAAELLHEHQLVIWRRTDRLFAGLLGFQWLGGISLALWRTPLTWVGQSSAIHPHVWAAVGLGACIILPPLLFALLRPGRTVTRHVVAVAQMLMSALLIHLGDGRIEMHFHVFGSLAFLAFYRDWRILISASVVVALDHFVRGIYIPQSVYGVITASSWRTLEHAGWVAFEDAFLITSCIQGVREMRGIAENRALLEHSYHSVEETVRQRTRELKEAQDDLLKVARSAGMAEIATSVLHNVGNVLNSVNVSANVVCEKLRQSEVASLVKVAEMIRIHAGDLPAFLTSDERGKVVPGFIADLARCLAEEQTAVLGELSTLGDGIEHIKQIVASQQSLAKRGSVCTATEPARLIETAVTMQSNLLRRGDIEIHHRFEDLPALALDQHKILQILINLVSNAQHAVVASAIQPKQITLVLQSEDRPGGKIIRFQVIDNGVGIAPEHLTRIFAHGFTTRANGHGYGLHSAANAAREMGGTLTAASDGPGRGAVFTLEVPVMTLPAGEACAH